MIFYLVGDVVSEDFLANEFLRSHVRLCIIDGKTQRREMKNQFESFFEESLNFKNPQGGINVESFSLLEKILSSKKRTLLKITEGEEDLLVLPLVRSIQLDSNIKHLMGTRNHCPACSRKEAYHEPGQLFADGYGIHFPYTGHR